MQCSVCKECKAEALSYGRGGRSPKTIGEVVYTDLEGPFNADVTGMRYFQVFVDEVSRDKRVFGLKTKDTAAAATTAYLDNMARGVPVKCISGDGAGELARSVRFQRMLADRGIKWRKSPPYTPQSNGITEGDIKQLMQAACTQLVRSGLGEEFWFFAVADAAFKSSGMPHEFLGGETPCERLTGKPFKYNRLRVCGGECFVHQNKKQRRSGSKFHAYAKHSILVGHNCTSLAWHVWLPQEGKFMTSAHVTFQHEARLVGDDDEETEEDTLEPSPIENEDFLAPAGDKRSAPHNGQRSLPRLEQRQRVDYTRQLFDMDEKDDSDTNNFPSTTKEALRGLDADKWEAAMNKEMGRPKAEGNVWQGDPSLRQKGHQEAFRLQD
ncbi:unnamed protein product [Discosporangium mesarthrocarpum]